MANPEHLEILKQGVEVWNKWRKDNPKVKVDLTDAPLARAVLRSADLRGANLTKANLSEVELIQADIRGADLTQADLRGANLEEANLREANLTRADLLQAWLHNAHLKEVIFMETILTRATLTKANLTGANLTKAKLMGAVFVEVDLSGADLTGQNLERALLIKADLSGANLTRANLTKAYLSRANLRKANLTKATLTEANLAEGSCLQDANLESALLMKADLTQADLAYANLTKADLEGADLRGANLTEANLEGANLKNCSVYGVSVWSVKLNETRQSDLIITPPNEPPIMLDNLEVAQFVYLLLNNKKIRDVINTIGEKGVLILGRFTEERKAVLDAIRSKLRELGYLPMIFDFEKPIQRDFTETIKTLAGLSRFIIADITNPKSSPLELQATMPDYMIPFVPIIHETEQPFAMFQDLKQKYGDWVLEVLQYDSTDGLMKVFEIAIVRPALEMSDKLLLKKAEVIRMRHVKDYE